MIYYVAIGVWLAFMVIVGLLTDYMNGRSRRYRRREGDHSYGETESVLEEQMQELLETMRFDIPLTQYWIRTGWWVFGRWHRLDFAYPDLKIAIEVDGARYHDPYRDGIRDRRLSNRGWRTLRFTWEEVTGRPDRVTQELQRAGVPGASPPMSADSFDR